jgi:hypothetical protein
MTIDEAIEHCLDNVEKERKNCNNDCAKEHEQLAEWLKELKCLKEQKDPREKLSTLGIGGRNE